MPTLPIGEFFRQLGFPLKNQRWSWGANNGSAILLRAWDDEKNVVAGRYVLVLGARINRATNLSHGLTERVDHLRMLWAGGLPAYVVMAKAKDINARPRDIESYDAENVRAILSLVSDSDGSIWAEFGNDVPIAKLDKHIAHHRIQQTAGDFPDVSDIGRVAATRSTTKGYVAKIPAMRAKLIDVARGRKTISYTDIRTPFSLKTFELRHAMDRLGHECLDAREPILTSLIVDPTTGRCSGGFYKEFQCDDVQEREDCYSFWEPKAPTTQTTAPAQAIQDDALRVQALAFAKVAVRKDQAAFRRNVFLAYDGRCTVTGCDVAQVLDAAHRRGRDWKLGHNRAEDGILLRKDIHALYDAGLVDIGNDGKLIFPRSLIDHYAAYALQTGKS